jgi:ABC-type sugar transport system substrate-binding protein
MKLTPYSRMSRFRRRICALSILVAVGMLGTACSSSSSGNQAGTSSSSGTTTSSSGTTTSNIALQQALEGLTTRPTKIPLTTPLGAPVPKNLTIDFIGCGVPACTKIANFIKTGTDALGYKLVVSSVGTTSTSAKAAFDAVIAQRPAALIASPGGALSTYAPELSEIRKLGIVDVVLSVNTPPEYGVNAELFGADNFSKMGVFLAKYVIASAGGAKAKPNAVMVYPPAFGVNAISANSFKSEFAQTCPGCGVATLPVPVTAIGSDLPSLIVGYLQAHPSVQYVATAFDDMTLGLPQALRTAGLASRVKILSLDNEPALSQYIANGQVLATVQQPWETIGYLALDYILRTLDKKPTNVDLAADEALPLWAVTKQNLPAGATSQYFPMIATSLQQFEKLWGISS